MYPNTRFAKIRGFIFYGFSLLFLTLLIACTANSAESNNEAFPTMTNSPEITQDNHTDSISQHNEGSDFTVDVIGFTPWGIGGLEKQPIVSSMLDSSGTPQIMGWGIPQIVPSDDGTIWLRHLGRAINIDTGGGQSIDFLSAANIDGVISIIATAKSFIIGSEGDESMALTRLGMDNRIIWHQSTPFSMKSPFKQRQLLLDADGTPYLYAATDVTGQLWKIDVDNGLLESVFTFNTYQPKQIWIMQNRLYWWQYDPDLQIRLWHWHSLTNDTQGVVENSPLQNLFSSIHTPLSDGGAVLSTINPHALVWMNADGSEQRSLSVADLMPDEWIESQQQISLPSISPQSDGSFLFVGTDEAGAYVLQLIFSE